FQPLPPFAFELSLPFSPLRRLLLTPLRDGIPCSSPPLPDRGRVEHSAPPAWVECSGDWLGGASGLGSPWQPPRRGVRAIHLARLRRRGTADFFILAAAAGRLRPPASASDAPLSPPGVHLCAFMRDVRGSASLRHPLPLLLHPGEVRKEQGRSGWVLLPDKERPADSLHSGPCWRKVGGVAQGLGDCHH